jgi:hypothetical protein
MARLLEHIFILLSTFCVFSKQKNAYSLLTIIRKKYIFFKKYPQPASEVAGSMRWSLSPFLTASSHFWSNTGVNPQEDCEPRSQRPSPSRLSVPSVQDIWAHGRYQKDLFNALELTVNL